jgi:hypothetical protein
MDSRVPDSREPGNPHIIPGSWKRETYLIPGYRDPENPHIIPDSWLPENPEPDGFPVPGNPQLTWVPGFQKRNRKLTPLVESLKESYI